MPLACHYARSSEAAPGHSLCLPPQPALVTAGSCTVPKLTVRVRFPSPAPHTKSVATVGDSRLLFSGFRRYEPFQSGVNDPQAICRPHMGHRLQSQHRSSGSQSPVSVRRWRGWATAAARPGASNPSASWMAFSASSCVVVSPGPVRYSSSLRRRRMAPKGRNPSPNWARRATSTA